MLSRSALDERPRHGVGFDADVLEARTSLQELVEKLDGLTPQQCIDKSQQLLSFARRDTSRPDRRPTVAVMYFDNGALTNSLDYAPLSKGLADMLVVSLTTNCGIRVVEREQLQRLLTEQNLSADRMDCSELALSYYGPEV